MKEQILQYIKYNKIELEVFETVTSTNDLLKQKAVNGAKSGTVVIAKTQTKGRGRRGKTFISKEGGLYLSILLRPKEFNFDTTLLTSAAAVAVSKAIEETSGIKTDIKWVNDVLINGKKVCGILCESGVCGNEYFVIVGIGINLFEPENGFEGSIKDIATCVFKQKDQEKANKLTAKVIDNFFEIYNSGGFLNYYKDKNVVIGKDIFVLKNGEKITAKAIEIDDKCRLKVLYKDGKTEYLSSGEISVKLK